MAVMSFNSRSLAPPPRQTLRAGREFEHTERGRVKNGIA